MKISIFGAGYVGLVTSACLADLGHLVLCVDTDTHKIESLTHGQIPFFEPGLDSLVKKTYAKGKLRFTSDSREAVEFGDVIFICVGTPSLATGEADVRAVLDVATVVARHINGYKVVVVKSTVPPGTTRKVYDIIKQHCERPFDVVANPEFLREGVALRAFQYPDKIVVGAASDKAVEIMRKVYSGRMRTYLPLVDTNWETAELIKYASNCFLAMKISLANEFANLCDIVGADIKTLAFALGLDNRIGPRFLNAGVGYGGSCFPKDVHAIAHFARKHGYTASLIEGIEAFNERQKNKINEKIAAVFGNVRGKTFCVWGLSFKPGTSDMRAAPSIAIVQKLLHDGASVRVYDPEATDEARKIFGDHVVYCGSAEEAAQGSDAILLVTEWDEFRNVDLGSIRASMKGNKLFDGRNIYEPHAVRDEGFEYYGMGKN
ncbi:MAG TPA: UDP-glucose/GDP-mannose dehydrogenase family protein [Candidatus Nanoarchaeia archaeon]|nr:UDP-glucose/GDP-mannose dehydrogenase family protein [Candidatus Nanoarchaeia archaeon]